MKSLKQDGAFPAWYRDLKKPMEQTLFLLKIPVGYLIVGFFIITSGAYSL